MRTPRLDLSIRSLPLFGVLLITVLALSGAQSGAGDGVLPTSPSPSAGPSAAAGTWRLLQRQRQVASRDHRPEGNVIEDIETTVSQDGQGNISFVNEDELVTLKRVGRA